MWPRLLRFEQPSNWRRRGILLGSVSGQVSARWCGSVSALATNSGRITRNPETIQTQYGNSFPQGGGKPLANIVLPTANDRAVWKFNLHCRNFFTVDQSRLEIDEDSPLTRVFGAGDLAGRLVHDRVSSISLDSAFRNVRAFKFLPTHRLDRIPPQRSHRPMC